MDEDVDRLIAELPRWNNGAGISPEGWISCMGNYELAIGYSLVFWPRFERIGPCIVRRDIGPFARERVEKCAEAEASGVEAMVNHLHILDLHCNVETPPDEAQLRHLGRTLKQMWEAKLGLDFPDLTFELAFNDEPGRPAIDYQLTFWRVRDEPGAVSSSSPG